MSLPFSESSKKLNIILPYDPEKLLSRNFQSPWQSWEELGWGSEMKLSRLCGARAGGGTPRASRGPGSTPGPGEHLASNTALVPGGQAGAVLAVPFSETCTPGF